MNSHMRLLDTHLRLNVLRSRTCYSIEPDVSKEDWEAMLIEQSYEEGYRPRMYICFPTKDESQELVERYFFVYNQPDPGVALDNNSAMNRWFMTFRGERDFHVFMENLRGEYGLMYRGQEEKVIEPIINTMQNMRASSLLNRPSFPGAVAAPKPGEEYYDRKENFESDLTKFFNWIGSASPWNDQTADHNLNQNSPETRAFNAQ